MTYHIPVLRYVTLSVTSHIIWSTSCILNDIQPPMMSALYWCRSTPNHNSLVTTTPSGDAGSTWVLRHNLDPEHVPAFRHPVTIDPSGDPTLEFQTGSMIHPELMSYRRSEPVGDNRSRR